MGSKISPEGLKKRKEAGERAEREMEAYMKELELEGIKNRKERQELIENTSFENGIADCIGSCYVTIYPLIITEFAKMHKNGIDSAADLYLLFSIYALCNSSDVKPTFKVLNDLSGMDSERIQELSEYLLKMGLISE